MVPETVTSVLSRSLPHVAALLAILACAPSLTAQDLDETQHGNRLRSGDRVTVKLYTSAGQEVAVVGGQRTIDADGQIFLPYIRTIRVSEYDQTALREELTARYSAFYADPVVDVTVELRVSVTGAVANAGQFYLDPTATVVDAIARAGGMYSELAVSTLQIPADQGSVRLVRDGEPIILNLRPDEITDEILHMRIQSGDWIYVPFRGRSQVRDEILFWGGVIGFVVNVIGLVILIGN